MKNDCGKRLTRAAVFVRGFLCACLLLAAVTAGRHIRAVHYPTLKDGERLLDKGKPREAKARLDKIKPSKRDDACSRELLLRGRVYYAVMLEEMRAEKWARYGVNPDNWLAHPLADEAERCFLSAMEAAPDDPEIRLTLGNLYREQGRFAESESALRAALDIDPEHAEAYLALGLLYAEGKRQASAEKALRHAWSLDGGNPKISKNIGYYYRFYKDVPESSIVWFSRYLEAGPKRDWDINLIRAELRNITERYPEYESNYRERENLGSRGAGRSFARKAKK